MTEDSSAADAGAPDAADAGAADAGAADAGAADAGALPSTGMATGNDEGEPGERLAEPELSADEQVLLQRLLRPASGSDENAQ